MKWGGIFVAGILLAKGQELELELELPRWEENELEDLESGHLIPGSGLLGPGARDFLFGGNNGLIELDPSVRDLPGEDPEEEELWVSSIDPTFFDGYFRTQPEVLLVDPQQLLTTREYRDREEFLNYHSRDTAIDFYLYVFDARQEVPEGESAQRVVNEFFKGERAVAVVFYYLGMPGRSQVGYSKRVRESVSEHELDKILGMSVEEALGKSDPASQMESFSVQFSIRLYWLEKMVAKSRSHVSTLDSAALLELEAIAEGRTGFFDRLERDPLMFYGVTVGGVLVSAVLLGLLGRYFFERKRQYLFPDAQGNPLLGAPHAAGVGGVISYASVSLPPSSQREEVPNYLQRM